MLRQGFALVLVAFVLLSIAPASSPVQLSYVYSDSMEPAIDEGDGYVLVPAGPIESGDIITFYSATQDGYVTHRVVGETERGFITRGDDNPSTDQAGGAPPVQRERIVGEVLTVGGTPLVIPHLGTLIEAVRTNQFVTLAAAALAALGLHAVSSTRQRDVFRVREVAVPALLGLALLSVVFVVAGASHVVISYSVAETAATNPNVLTLGEQVTRTHRVFAASPRFSQLVVDVEGMTVVDRDVSRGDGLLIRRTSVNLTTEFTPRTLGTHRGEIAVYAYPPLLPRGVLETLHGIRPLAAAAASVFLTYGPLGAGYLLLVNGAKPLRAPRSRRLRRLFQR